jgi:hypothetical protein
MPMAAAAVENLAGRWSAPVLVSAISLRRRRIDHWRVLAVGFDLLATKSLQNPTLGFASVDHCVHARAPHTAGSNHSVAYSMVLRCVPRHRSSLSYVHVRRPTHGYQYHTHVPVFFFCWVDVLIYSQRTIWKMHPSNGHLMCSSSSIENFFGTHQYHRHFQNIWKIKTISSSIENFLGPTNITDISKIFEKSKPFHLYIVKLLVVTRHNSILEFS